MQLRTSKINERKELRKVPEKAPGGRARPADGPQAGHLGGGERLHRDPRAGQVQHGPGRRLAAGEAAGQQVATRRSTVDGQLAAARQLAAAHRLAAPHQLAAARHLQAVGSGLEIWLLVC